MSIEIISQKKCGILVYDSQSQMRRAEFVNNIKDGKYVREVLTVPNKGKSWAQCKLIFGNMIANAVRQANERHITVERFLSIALKHLQKNIPIGIPLDEGFMHQFMYIISPTFNTDGEPVTLSRMDKDQASRLFKLMQIFLASPGLEIRIDDPPELEELKKIGNVHENPELLNDN